VEKDSPDDEDPAFRVVVILFDEHLWEGLVSFGVNYRDRGLLYVDDAPELAALLDVPESFFCRDPRAFTDTDGALTAPWPATVEVARLPARTRADHLMAVVHQHENQARQAAIYGRYYPGRGKNPGTHISPEICAEVDRSSSGPQLWQTSCTPTTTTAATPHSKVSHPSAASTTLRVRIPARWGDWGLVFQEGQRSQTAHADRLFAPNEQPVSRPGSRAGWWRPLDRRHVDERDTNPQPNRPVDAASTV
jgi:hypothetical protein